MVLGLKISWDMRQHRCASDVVLSGKITVVGPGRGHLSFQGSSELRKGSRTGGRPGSGGQGEMDTGIVNIPRIG